MEKIKFFMEYEHQWIDHPLTVSLYVDNRLIHFDQGNAITIIDKKIAVDKGKHTLLVKIGNKNQANTVIDKQNNILQDSVIRIKSIKINDIDINSIMMSDCEYHCESQIVLKQVTELGFNGKWQLEFSVPVYDWLLEKLF